MLSMTYQVKRKCPRHPRFNPEHGPGAIVGACHLCNELLQLYRALIGANRTVGPALEIYDHAEQQWWLRQERPARQRQAARFAA